MEKKLKVLMLIDKLAFGKSQAERSVDNYATNLTHNAEVVVATLSLFDQVDKPYRIITASNVAKLYRILQKIKFDIIHIHSNTDLMALALRLGRESNIPVVATIHSNAVAKYMSENTKLIARSKIRKLINYYNQLDELFVSSPYVAEDLRENGFKGKVSYLPLGSDLDAKEKKAELIKIAEHYFDLKHSDNVLISLGNVRKTKRIDFVIRSLKKLKDLGVEFKYFAIGGGEEIPNLRDLTHKLGLEKQVFLLGYTRDIVMNPLIARADLLLYPSTYDYYGLAKTECAGFATAGVYIKDSFVANEVFHDINGFVSANNEEEYAKTIATALKSKKHLVEVSKNAYNDLFLTWDKCTTMLEDRLQGIVKEKNKLSKKIIKNDKKVK